MAGSAAKNDAVVGGADTGERLACLVAGRPRPLGGGVGDRCGLRAVPSKSAWARSSSSTTSRRAGRVSSSARSSSPAAARSSPRQSARRPAAASRSPARSARARSGCPSSLLVAGGLLEVVAEDLVQLDQLLAALLEPAGEALVQLRPRGLRERVVGGVADQQVAEAEAVLAARTAPCRDGSAPGARAPPGAASPGSPPGASACTAPRWKTSPSTAPRSSTRRSAGSSWSRRAASSAFNVGGTSTSSPASPAIASISPMKSGLPPAAAAILARSSSGTAAPIRLAASSPLERLEPHRHRPGGAAVEQLGAGHAEQQERGAAGEQRDMLDQVEERLLAPLDVVEHDHERRLLLEQLAERPGDLLRRRPRLRLAQQRADRRRGGRIGRQHVELLDHLDDRPVGDPDPVGQAAAAHDPRLDRGRAPPPPAATCRAPHHRRP